MNQNIIKCFGCGLFFTVATYSLLPYFLQCEEYWRCEPQEHIENRPYFPSYFFNSSVQANLSASLASTAGPLLDNYK